MSKEAAIHFELYCHLQNAIENDATHYGVEFTRVDPERSAGSGYADLVVERAGGEPFLVVEAKREPVDDPPREIDPYAVPVVEQAASYAVSLGAPYFATYNGQKLVLFTTFERGTPLLERKTRAYEVSDSAAFAETLLRETAGVDSDQVSWDPHSEAFLDRLDSLHSKLATEFRRSLEETLTDDSFADDYEKWVEQQGWRDDYEDDPDAVHDTYAQQAAYLLVNKLVFLKLLEDTAAYTDVPEFELSALAEPERRRQVFDELIEAVDFEAVYRREEIFDQVPLTDTAVRAVEEAGTELESYDLERQFDDDVIGQMYERIIPAAERHELGQYYTPPPVVDLITRLTVRDADDTVLDPACGSGGFLVGAYDRLDALGADDHHTILDQLYGIDVNRFPAHLSAINLAVRDLTTQTNDTNVEVQDFFRVDPEQGRLGSQVEHAAPESDPTTETPRNSGDPVDVPPTVDAVVANPPYIRSRNIPDVELATAHLDDLGYEFDGNSDIYSYFFTHAFQFLRDGGRMGFLTSNRWLTAEYGEDLERFLFENMAVDAVVTFQTQLFDVPLISTCITIARRCDDAEKRRNNRVNLVHVTDELDTDRLVDVVTDGSQELGTLRERPGFRRATFLQSTLRELDRWDQYLFGPRIYFEVRSNCASSLCRLGEFAEISRGFTTGANDYFYFQEREAFEEHGIDPAFVSPLCKHISPTEYVDLRETDPTWYYLDTSSVVADVLDEHGSFGDTDPAATVKQALAERDADGLLDYLTVGEERGIDDPEQYPTVAGKGRVWFDVGEATVPPIILAKEYWRDARVLRNSAGVALDQRNYAVVPAGDIDETLLLGVLNASLTALIREMEGREQQGQAMNRNELTVRDAETMHVPDVRQFSEADRRRVREATERLLAEERTATETERERLQEELDRAVLAAIGFAPWGSTELDNRVDALHDAVEQLVERREQGAGRETEVLIGDDPDGLDDADDYDLPGGSRLSDGGQFALDEF